ncbi:hypothetical protein DV735_g4297, partial [Chaetothyriales sp. CBS 134920]
MRHDSNHDAPPGPGTTTLQSTGKGAKKRRCQVVTGDEEAEEEAADDGELGIKVAVLVRESSPPTIK